MSSMQEGVFSADGRHVDILQVTAGTLPQVWGTAYGLLEPMDAQVPCLIRRVDVPALVLSGQMQLWLLNDVQEFFFAGLTELREYPAGRLLNVFWASGHNMRNALPLLAYIEQWAAGRGAGVAQVQGRLGWTKMLRSDGYEPAYVALRKPLVRERMN